MWIIQKLSRVFGFSVYSIRIVGNVSLYISEWFLGWTLCGMSTLETHCHIRACDVTSSVRPDCLSMLMLVVSARLYFEYYIFDSNIWIYAKGVCINHIRLRWRNIFLVCFLDFLFRNIYCVYKCTSTKPLLSPRNQLLSINTIFVVSICLIRCNLWIVKSSCQKSYLSAA